MKLVCNGCCFRFSLEFFRPGPEPLFRKYHVRAQGLEYEARRQMLREVRVKLKAPPLTCSS